MPIHAGTIARPIAFSSAGQRRTAISASSGRMFTVWNTKSQVMPRATLYSNSSRPGSWPFGTMKKLDPTAARTIP
jgi:hypothetical protein